MAIKTFRVQTTTTNNSGDMVESDQTAANRADGWTSAKLAAAQMAEFDAATKLTSAAFSASTKPASLITGTACNAFSPTSPLTGTFAATAWTFTFALRCTLASSQRGRIRMRVFEGPNADGSGAAELTGSTQVGTTVAAALSTTADQTSVVTWSPGATVTLNNEYLFFVIAWEITTAGGSNSADVVIRTGQSAGGSRCVTPDFVAPVAVGDTDASGTITESASVYTITPKAGTDASSTITETASVATDPYMARVLALGPTGYWRMEESGLPQDFSGTGNHMTGDVRTVPQATGLLSSISALKARGFVEAGGGSFVNRGGLLYPLNTFTIEMWVKRTRTGVGEVLFSQYNGGLRVDIDSGGTISLVKSFVGYCSSSSVLKINDTNTHHIVVTRNGIGGAVIFYLDGVAETGSALNPSYDFSTGAANGFFIGSEWGANPFDGTLDEMAIYPTVLTPAQVRGNFNAGLKYATEILADSPLFYYRLDELSGTVAFDAKGNLDGTYGGTSTLGQSGALEASGDFGKSVNFASGHVVVPADSRVYAATTFTAEAWIYPTGTTGTTDAGIINSLYNGNPLPVILCYGSVENVYSPGQRLWVGFFSSGTWKKCIDPTVLPLNAWTHVAGTYDGTTLRLYRNGVEVANLAVSGQQANAAQISLVGRNWGNNYSFPGKLDEVALYTTALSATAILEHFNVNQAPPASVPASDTNIGITETQTISVPVAVTDTDGVNTETAAPTYSAASADVDGANTEIAAFTAAYSSADASGAITEVVSLAQLKTSTDVSGVITEIPPGVVAVPITNPSFEGV